jgi:hypothetical protein
MLEGLKRTETGDEVSRLNEQSLKSTPLQFERFLDFHFIFIVIGSINLAYI